MQAAWPGAPPAGGTGAGEPGGGGCRGGCWSLSRKGNEAWAAVQAAGRQQSRQTEVTSAADWIRSQGSGGQLLWGPGGGGLEGGREVGRKKRFRADVEEICFRHGELKVPAGASRMPLQMQEGPSGRGFAPKMWRRASHA